MIKERTDYTDHGHPGYQHQAPYVRASDSRDELGEMLRVDSMFGKILAWLAAFGLFCAFMEGCFFWGICHELDC